MNHKIAIIYTTFLRNDLAFKTIESIQPQLNENIILLIGDQNKITNKLNINPNWHYTFVFNLPFDCGLSYARNNLINRAKILGCDYILMTADSIEFTNVFNFNPIINFMETNENIVKCGFNLNNRIPWEFNIELKNSFNLVVSNERINFFGEQFKKVDICRNFFLGKIDAFIKIQYDNELKLCEHEDHCWRLKLASYQTYYTDIISANYIDYKPEEYKKLRDRLTKEFRQKLLKKYNISHWVTYSPEVTTIFKNWRNKCI